jgi:hypothetical protein
MGFLDVFRGSFLFPKHLAAIYINGDGGEFTVCRAVRGEKNPAIADDRSGLPGIHAGAPTELGW